MLDSVADFGGLGDTIQGKNDAGDLINVQLQGCEYTFPVTEEVAAAFNMTKRTVGRRITARILRNETGATLYPGEVVEVDLASGFAGLGKTISLSGAGDRCCLVVDPAINATTGVADDDLFYAIVSGPAQVKQPASSAPTLVVGDVIKAGASGRLAKGAVGTDDGLILGTVLEADATGVEDALIDVDLAPVWV